MDGCEGREEPKTDERGKNIFHGGNAPHGQVSASRGEVYLNA
jgi:hypothetical protein